MQDKMTHEELMRMLSDPDVPEEQLLPYLEIDDARSRALSPVLRLNPNAVVLSEDKLSEENAMQIGNGFSRWRRQLRFKRRVQAGDTSPVIVSEGDSWFQFPLLLEDVIDQLSDKYLIWSCGAAGDTARNMISGPMEKEKSEYLQELRKHEGTAKAFMMSAAGNDVIGEDADGNPVMDALLKSGSGDDPHAYIDLNAFESTLATLRAAYETVVDSIRSFPALATLPIIVHGYDYPIPGSADDARNPIYAKPDQWLGAPMRAKGIADPGLQKAITKTMIDGLYDMMTSLAAADSRVHVVDVRGTLPQKSDWADEIHPTNDGFKRVATKFDEVIARAIS